LDVPILPSHPFLQNGFAIALELQHPIYDCVYLAVAIATDRTLVTADERFLAKLAGSRFGRDRVTLLATFA
jgi:predicted nucleic acid-binding protein